MLRHALAMLMCIGCAGCSLLVVPEEDYSSAYTWNATPKGDGERLESGTAAPSGVPTPTPLPVFTPAPTPTASPTPRISEIPTVVAAAPSPSVDEGAPNGSGATSADEAPLLPRLRVTETIIVPTVVVTSSEPPQYFRLRKKIWPDFPWREGWYLYLLPLDEEKERIIANTLARQIGKFSSEISLDEEEYDYVIILSEAGRIYTQELINEMGTKGWAPLFGDGCVRHQRRSGVRHTLCMFTRYYERVKVRSTIGMLLGSNDGIDVAIVMRWNLYQ